MSSLPASSLSLVIALLWQLAPAISTAEENPYDLVSKTITPLLGPLTAAPAPAPRGLDVSLQAYPLSADGRTLTDSPPVTMRILFQAPKQVLVEGASAGSRGIICRNGNEIWAAPRVVFAPLLEQLAAAEQKNPTNLPDMILPVAASQAVLLPALLELKTRASNRIGNSNCTVVQARLLKQLEESLSIPGWQALLWIDPQDYSLKRVKVYGPSWGGRIDVTSLKTVTAFPEKVWQPAPGVDAIAVPREVFFSAIEALLELKTVRQLRAAPDPEQP